MDSIAYRSEKKYILSCAEAELIRARLRGLAGLDAHAASDGHYLVQSLYFDDYQNTAFTENEDGAFHRIKYRLRMYDGESDTLFLERKGKHNTQTCKLSERLTRETAEKLLGAQSAAECLTLGGELLREVALKRLQQGLHPVAIVSYRREPYVYPAERVRITFDTDVRASGEIDRFLAGDAPAIPVLPDGALIMEVKYDDFLPLPIAQAIASGSLTPSRYSKYHTCREILMLQGR